MSKPRFLGYLKYPTHKRDKHDRRYWRRMAKVGRNRRTEDGK